MGQLPCFFDEPRGTDGSIFVALVLIGKAEFGNVHEGGKHPAYDPPPLRLRTDAAGRFEATGVETGMVRVSARALGSGIANAEVVVPPGGIGNAKLVVGEPARIAGLVRRADGRAVAGARVAVEYDLRGLVRAMAIADEQGRFSLDCVPLGRVILIAEHDPERLAVRTVVETRAGEETCWQAIFPDTSALSGVLIDEDGAPLAGWLVRRESQGVSSADGNMARSSRTTADDGRFRIKGCPNTPQTLSARPPGQWTRGAATQIGGVLPGDEPVTLRVLAQEIPRGALFGRIVDAQGQGIGGARIAVNPGSPNFVHLRCESAADGTFSARHMPPSNYKLEIDAEGFKRIELNEIETLEEGDQRDLGQLKLERAD